MMHVEFDFLKNISLESVHNHSETYIYVVKGKNNEFLHVVVCYK